MLPCPGFPLELDFLPFAVEDTAVDTGVFSLTGCGSSSENDSHAGSSFVTVGKACQSFTSMKCLAVVFSTNQDTPLHL